MITTNYSCRNCLPVSQLEIGGNSNTLSKYAPRRSGPAEAVRGLG
jgi:hypothetical protein